MQEANQGLDHMEMDDDGQKYLTFTIGDVTYGFHISRVTEIIGLQRITVVPDVPHYVKGVINLRGKVIPLVDVRARVNLPEIDYHDRTCIIVVEVGGKSVGLVVDAVSEVLAIDESQIEPPPDFRAGKTAQYISGMAKVEDSVKVLLDADKLLAMDDVDTTGRRASA